MINRLSGGGKKVKVSDEIYILWCDDDISVVIERNKNIRKR